MWKLLAAAAVVFAAAPAVAEDRVVDTVTATSVDFLPLHIGGRVRKESLGYSYQWPGVYFEASFFNPFVNLLFNDDANNFNVILDGKLLMILRKPGHRSIMVQANGTGPHLIRVEKRSETQYATGHFQGIMAAPAPAAVPDLPRQIEFVGDSLTVGYGNTSAFTKCTPDEIFETTDAQQGFGPLVARHFNADYQINAFSGLGLVRNYDGREHPKYHMPMLYDRAIFDDPTAADLSHWHPQIVAIGIGGNDFSTPLHADETWKTSAELRADYEKAYIALVRKIRARNPDAFILLAVADGRGDYTDGTLAVLKTLKDDGEKRIDRITIPATEDTGCNGHPNIHDDARIAATYTVYLDAHPDLWQGQ
ncbi:MAG: lipolytic enzyme, G-D-S-L [Asticcacaulis sp.]|nr:lipolytic enzyme, G-D-S-L [Asticcacaulis sp.]